MYMEFIGPEFESHRVKKEKCLNELKDIIVRCNELLEGNCVYHHATLDEFPELYSKQLNLFWCGKQTEQKMCEIGFNAGHSSMILLLGVKTPINFTIFDTQHHGYTKPCFEYLQTAFDHVKFEFIVGDSTVTMPEWILQHQELKSTYDVIHVDGGHDEHCISNDMKNSDFLLKTNGTLIVDDTDVDVINKYVESYIASGNYREIALLPTLGYRHRVLRKIR